MRGIFLCILTMWLLQLPAQERQIDSLEEILQTRSDMEPGERADLLLQLAQAYLQVSPKQAVNIGLQAHNIMEELGDKAGMAAADKMVGKAYFVQSDFANALEYFNRALKRNREINNTGELAASYNNVGVVYNRLGYYDLALKNHLEQLRINEQTRNIRGIAISNSNIGNIYNNLNENDKALEHYREAMRISQQLQDSNAVANALINLGVVSMEIEQYPQAVDYFDRALEMKKALSDQINIGVIYSNLGLIARAEAHYEKANTFFNKSLDIARQAGNKQGMAVALTNLGELLLKQGDQEQSYRNLEEALTLATQIGAIQLVSEIYGYLSQWNEQRHHYAASLENYKQMTALQDSIMNTEKSRQIRNMQIVYEVEKKEKEILEQRVSIEKLKNNQIFLLLAIVIILALAFMIYYRYRTKKKLNRGLEVKIAEALRRQKEQQQIIVHQASLTSLGELAAGIAHEIRQPLQNISLANESLQIETREPDPDKAFISENLRNIGEDIKRIKFIITEISNFSRGQQEAIRESFSINTRIENAFSLARTKFANRNISVNFNLDKALPLAEGNPYKFEQVIVNFLNNAKDAIEEKAATTPEDFQKSIDIKSYADQEFIFVEVTDNGIGVPDDIKTNIFLPFYTTKQLGKGTGLGLSISLGIVKEMGGLIEIDSVRMQGTTMRIKIPRG